MLLHGSTSILRDCTSECVDQGQLSWLAVIGVDRQLTYAALDAAANRLAHHLISLRIGPESLVGIALERSPEMVVAASSEELQAVPGLPAKVAREIYGHLHRAG